MSVVWDLALPQVCGLGLHLCLDGFRLVYICIAILMWTVSGVFSKEYMAHYKNHGRYYGFFWATFAATVGVFLSADLYTTFIFFEIMSFTSYVWVAFDERRESLRAAQTYLAVAVIGGMVMLLGLFLLYDLFGTLEIDRLGGMAKEVLNNRESAADGISKRCGIFHSSAAQLYTAAGLLLFGFGAKAGMFPLHIWLPKAHPEAPAPTSALLSGILTKAGVFGIIVVSMVLFEAEEAWGTLIVALGLITMFLGAFLAVFSINLKRTLACSSISQIGFILTGIGMSCLLKSAGESNALAVRGAFLHMVNHSLFKLVLFLCAGVVFMNLHQLELNDIRGFGRKKPVLAFCFLMGALGIGGIPLWNGYISKTLIHESIVEYMELMGSPAVWKNVEWVFLFSGGMTVAYMLKLFVALFVEKHPQRQAEFDSMKGMNRFSAIALSAAAVILPVLGFAPHLTMDRIADLGQEFFLGAHGHQVSYFSFQNLKGGLISIGIGVVLYVVVVRGYFMEKEAEGKRYVNRWPSWLDLENLIYRPIINAFLAISAVVCRCVDQGIDGIVLLARVTTHSQKPKPRQQHDMNQLAYSLGYMIDRMGDFADRLRLPGKKRAGERKSVIPKLVRREQEIKVTGKLVEESFSFGLLLFCIGLCLTLGYLLVMFWAL
jgi:hydrogenase-4 component B